MGDGRANNVGKKWADGSFDGRQGKPKEQMEMQSARSLFISWFPSLIGGSAGSSGMDQLKKPAND